MRKKSEGLYYWKCICFLPLSANYSTYLFRQRLFSRLTALWRYINFVLLLISYYYNNLEYMESPPRMRFEFGFEETRGCISMSRSSSAC